MIYQPAEDSFLLKKHIAKYSKTKIILDMGTGSGILAEEASKNAKKVYALDTDKESIDYCRKKFGNKVDVRKSDLFSNIKEKFDLIIFNPPYLPKDLREDEKSARATTGGKKGFEIIERFLKEAKRHLNKDGKILFLFSSLSGDVENLFKKYGFKAKKIDEEKLFFEKLYAYLLQ